LIPDQPVDHPSADREPVRGVQPSGRHTRSTVVWALLSPAGTIARIDPRLLTGLASAGYRSTDEKQTSVDGSGICGQPGVGFAALKLCRVRTDRADAEIRVQPDRRRVGRAAVAGEATCLAYMTDEAVERRDAFFRSTTQTGRASRAASGDFGVACPNQRNSSRRHHSAVPCERCGASHASLNDEETGPEPC
jgi:hypothetical protein